MIEYDNLIHSLKLLEKQHNSWREMAKEKVKSDEDIEAYRESTIKRFEVCWDCLWKVLRRYLQEEIGLADFPNGPLHVIRLAAEADLLPSPAEKWLEYNRARINTSHDYSGEKATDTAEGVKDFIDDAIELYQTMTGETWA